MTKETEFNLSNALVKQLSQRSDRSGLTQLAGHLILLLLTSLAVAQAKSSLILLPAMLIHGIVLTFVFAPLHETIHFTAFKSIQLNNIVTAVSGFIMVLPYQYFRAYHSSHHHHTQSADKDPELIGKQGFTLKSYILHLSGLPFWRANFKNLYLHAKGKVTETYLHTRDHAIIIREARIHLASYLSLFILSLIFSTTELLIYWVVPLIIGQPFLQWFLLAEHSGCDLSPNMLENSRTTYTSPLINFLSWNMSYHAEHHYLASVPFHHLPALHAYTGQYLKFKGDGYWKVNCDIAGQIKAGDSGH
ncbi:MAG: fatty acid desaturase [Gammaproteobacteria bacterium]